MVVNVELEEEIRSRVFLKFPDKDGTLGQVMFRDVDAQMSLRWMIMQFGLLDQPIFLESPQGRIEHAFFKNSQGVMENQFQPSAIIGSPWLFVTMLPGASNEETQRRIFERFLEYSEKDDPERRQEPEILYHANSYFAQVLPRHLQKLVVQSQLRPFWWNEEEDSNESAQNCPNPVDDGGVRLIATPIMEYAKTH